MDPNLYENDDNIYAALKRSDHARLEILSNLLSCQLGLKVHNCDERDTKFFPNAYFLGCFEVANTVNIPSSARHSHAAESTHTHT